MIVPHHHSDTHLMAMLSLEEFGIIPNEDLKQLHFNKGPNYREQTSIDWGYNIKLIFTDIKDYTKSGQRKNAKNMNALKTGYSSSNKW